MTPQDWAAFALSITSLVGAFALMIRWMVKHYLTELKPNGGNSVRDRIDSITCQVDRLEARIDEIYRLLVKKQ